MMAVGETEVAKDDPSGAWEGGSLCIFLGERHLELDRRFGISTVDQRRACRIQYQVVVLYDDVHVGQVPEREELRRRV